MERHKLYEEYFESVYARSNSLTKDEYENAFKDFERLYGKILNSRNGNKV
jgi:hypothetical protein